VMSDGHQSCMHHGSWWCGKKNKKKVEVVDDLTSLTTNGTCTYVVRFSLLFLSSSILFGPLFSKKELEKTLFGMDRLSSPPRRARGSSIGGNHQHVLGGRRCGCVL
jgi:hypothetical protein